MQTGQTIIQLRTKGFRMGRVRKSIIDQFSLARKPVTAQDLINSLSQQHIPANKTTVYRELDFLTKMGFIRELYLQKNVRHFEPADQGHHHHIVCENCDHIVPVTDGKLEQKIREFARYIQQSNNFIVDRHALEFFGVCQNCQ